MFLTSAMYGDKFILPYLPHGKEATPTYHRDMRLSAVLEIMVGKITGLVACT
jgi:hypothetical protein